MRTSFYKCNEHSRSTTSTGTGPPGAAFYQEKRPRCYIHTCLAA
ncbi:unnamed protein product [Amoebophrya sp. A25]|nr:unnamed protein product [Amoebophrya sp. A25]|eukprot:GSA25T00016772001.1